MSTIPANDALLTFRALHIIGHQTDVIFDRLLQDEFGLTLSRFRILLPLIELGPATQSQVARFNLVTEASIGRQVRLLVETGYLKQVPCKVDARKYYLTLTKKTQLLVPRITTRLCEELLSVYGDMTTTELATLNTLLDKLLTLGSVSTTDAVTCTA